MAQDRMTVGNSGTAGFGLCAGGRLVPVVHVCAGKAAEREGFCCAQVGRRLWGVSTEKEMGRYSPFFNGLGRSGYPLARSMPT